jgi:formate/nitrite transporter
MRAVLPSHAATAEPAVSSPSLAGSPLDALPPPEIARKAAEVGVLKARQAAADTLVLAVLAGAFIALGAAFATTVSAEAAELPYGVGRLLTGLAFSLGLVLVVVAGAELFTGNNLIVLAWASRRVSTIRLLRNWALAYAGNFAGAVATALLVYAGKQYTFGGGTVGQAALATAVHKTSLGFVEALALGALCNALVCLAVWLTYSARSTADRILAIVPPITAFVALGFEHSIANMYFIPVALLIERDQGFTSSLGSAPADLGGLGWGSFAESLVPVTLGNIAGGALMVGAVYWLVYLRPRPSE